MSDRESQSFDACLPRLAQPVRISSVHDARIFARRWMIRDKDPALKALARRLDKARSSDAEASAVSALRQALEARSLLPQRRTRHDGD